MSETLAVALLGSSATVAGVLLTLVVQSLTERWRATREREGRLFATRQDLYSRYLRHARTMIDWLQELSLLSDYAPEEVDVDDEIFDPEKWDLTATRLVSEILLIGGRSVVAAASDLHTALSTWAPLRLEYQESGVLDVRLDELSEEEPSDQEYIDSATRLQESEQRLQTAALADYELCLQEMRRELGAEQLA